MTALAAEAPEEIDIRVGLGQGRLNLSELRAITGDGAGAIDAFRQWRQVETLLMKADASTPLGDWEEELLTVARVAFSGVPR